MDIARQVQQQPAPHVVVAIADIIHTHLTLTPTHLPIQRQAVQVVEVVAQQENQNLAGLEQILQFFIRLLRYRLYHNL